MKNCLRVVSIVTQMEGGGAQAVAMRVSAQLRERGHVAETWFLYQKRPTYVGYEGVRVVLPRPPRHGGDYVRVMVGLVRELRRYRADAVITYTHYANTLGQIAAWLTGVRSRVASQRNPSWTYPRVAREVDRLLGSLGLYTSNVMVSRSVYKSFIDYPGRYVRCMSVIYNGIAYTRSLLSSSQVREKFSLSANVPVVVNIGRLAHQKNHIVLLRALTLLPRVHLAIAGDGELREELKSQAKALGVKDQVHFLGEIAPADIPDLLAAGDLFAIPSHFEGHSNVLIEAISAGLPVISSDIPAQAEVLKPEGEVPAGILLPPDDPHAWAEAIRQLLENERLRADFAASALRRSSYFTLEQMIKGYELCIRRGLNDEPHRD